MEGYKVIKDFSFAEKGDVFTKVEDLNLWELQKSEVVSDTETYTSMAFDSSTMEELANKDYVIWYSEEAEEDDNEDECECCCDKLEKVKEYVNTLIDTYTKDYVIWYSEEAEEDDNEDECECCCDKLEKVKEYVNTLIDTYTKDYNELMKDYNEGNVQQCVKVEAETVYHNLNKVLNSIKDLLDE